MGKKVYLIVLTPVKAVEVYEMAKKYKIFLTLFFVAYFLQFLWGARQVERDEWEYYKAATEQFSDTWDAGKVMK